MDVIGNDSNDYWNHFGLLMESYPLTTGLDFEVKRQMNSKVLGKHFFRKRFQWLLETFPQESFPMLRGITHGSLGNRFHCFAESMFTPSETEPLSTFFSLLSTPFKQIVGNQFHSSSSSNYKYYLVRFRHFGLFWSCAYLI